MIIISLDPGGTTGFACGELDEIQGLLKVRSSQDKWSHSVLYAQLSIAHPDWIVCESFEYRNRARAGLELISCELIGVVHLYVQQYKCELTMQTASTGKGHFTDEKLKADGLYKTSTPHGNDATRHLLHWFVFGPGYQFNKQGYTKQ
jgi:hypothetical protein